MIPARGGSKRIPGKNIREFAGKPMIAHPIGRALASGLFERVIVSTDSEEITAVARACGAEVPFMRPPEIADDHADTLTVVSHAVRFLQQEGMALSAVCCIYPTAPFVSVEDLEKSLALLEGGPWQFVFPAAPMPATLYRSFRQVDNGGLEMLFPQHWQTRSQDLPEVLHDAGQFYWGRPAAWLARKPIFAGQSTVLRIPASRVQDIDTLEDWDRAAAIMARLMAEGGLE